MESRGLFGREAQQERIDQLLTRARAGQSGALVLIGEPGIGKTRLLTFGAGKAAAAGMQVLRAQGVEAESELAFSGLLELVRPVLHLIPSIPGPQGDALAGALALGPATAGDRFNVYAGVLSLLAAAAEREPLLVLVDDVHWLDRESQEALLFAARRLKADRVALMLAVREGHADVFAKSGVPLLRLSGLAPAAAAELLAQARVAPLPPEVTEQLLEATTGNPLALEEASALLSEEQVRGVEPLHHPLPMGLDLTMAFTRRVATLPAAAKGILVLAAASETGDTAEIVTAARWLGLDASAIGIAEADRLVVLDSGRVRFSHPLLRSAIYHAAPARERRAAHAALAEAISAPGDSQRRAWHRAIATVAPDETIAAELERAAGDAAARGAPAVAASTYERAARLSPAAEYRAWRLFRAANESRKMGSFEHVFTLLDQARALTVDVELSGQIQGLRGLVMAWSHPSEDAARILIDEAARVERSHPGRAAVLLAHAVNANTARGDLGTAAELARRAFDLASQGDGLAAGMAATHYGGILVMLGEASRAETFLAQGRSMVNDMDARRPLEVDVGLGFMWSEDFDTAGRFFDRRIKEARSIGGPAPLPLPLVVRSELDFRTGNWSRAFADASEALRLAEQTNAPMSVCYALLCLARVAAGQGRDADCRQHVDRSLAIAGRVGYLAAHHYAHAALGLLELGLGHLESAVDRLELVRELGAQHGVGEPTLVQSSADLIEAYVRERRTADAREALDRFEERAHATGRIWSLATTARCRGLLADEAEFEDEFGQALSYHDRLPMPFERARTELCLGERRRRSGRKAEAVRVLRSAAATFEQLDAAPWFDRARRELEACGVARRPRPSLIRSLTPQELQVALVVAEGATNREAGATLFLSPKTVEFHLANVYGKLGLRSRAELARLVAHGGLATA